MTFPIISSHRIRISVALRWPSRSLTRRLRSPSISPKRLQQERPIGYFTRIEIRDIKGSARVQFGNECFDVVVLYKHAIQETEFLYSCAMTLTWFKISLPLTVELVQNSSRRTSLPSNPSIGSSANGHAFRSSSDTSGRRTTGSTIQFSSTSDAISKRRLFGKMVGSISR